MRKLLLYPFVVVYFLIAGCNRCEDVKCLNGGDCEDGTCDCPNGFTGEDCATEDVCYTGKLVCQHDGACENNACLCDEYWWTGDSCQTKILNERLGEYIQLLGCDTLPPDKELKTATIENVIEDTAGNRVLVRDGLGRFEIVFEQDQIRFKIPLQQYDGSQTVAGEGKMDGDSFDYFITVYDFTGAIVRQCDVRLI